MRKFAALAVAYLFPGILGTVASVVGIAGGLDSLFGGSNSGTPSGGVRQYQPQNQAAVDAGWNNANNQIGWNNAAAQGATGDIFNAFNQANGINYAPYLEAMQRAGGIYGQQAGLDQSGAAGMVGQANNAAQRGGQVYNAGMQTYLTALDPQQALFNQQQQLVTDQTNAGQAARGLGNSAQGAGELQQNLNNFDINWQNQQLQRQIQGAQALNQGNLGANQSNQLYGADVTGASGLLGQGAQAQGMAGQTPLNAQQYAAGAGNRAATDFTSQLAALNNLWNQQQGNELQYLGQGSSAASAANNTAFGQQNFNANQQNMGANALTQGLNGLSGTQAGGWLNNLFGGNANTNGTSGDYTNLFAGAPSSYSTVQPSNG